MKSSYNEEELGFVYLAEQTSPDGNVAKNMNVCDMNGVFYVDFDADLHSFGVMNRNERIYDGQNVWDCICRDDAIQSRLRDNSWFGEQDHPFQMTTDAPLTPKRLQTIYLPNRSHKIMNPRLDGNLLHAHIQTSSGTEAGVGMAKDIIQGMVPDFSCRSVAGLYNIGGQPKVIVKKVITYDWVLYPSHKEAHITSSPKAVMKRPKLYMESGEELKYSTDVLIPLKEILESVGKKDPTVNVIMESFDLGPESLVGFDSSLKHAKIKMRDSMIYANINPDTVKEVRDYFTSF